MTHDYYSIHCNQHWIPLNPHCFTHPDSLLGNGPCTLCPSSSSGAWTGHGPPIARKWSSPCGTTSARVGRKTARKRGRWWEMLGGEPSKMRASPWEFLKSWNIMGSTAGFGGWFFGLEMGDAQVITIFMGSKPSPNDSFSYLGLATLGGSPWKSWKHGGIDQPCWWVEWQCQPGIFWKNARKKNDRGHTNFHSHLENCSGGNPAKSWSVFTNPGLTLKSWVCWVKVMFFWICPMRNPPDAGNVFGYFFFKAPCLIAGGYPLVNEHSHWKWWFIVDLPIENGDVP